MSKHRSVNEMLRQRGLVKTPPAVVNAAALEAAQKKAALEQANGHAATMTAVFVPPPGAPAATSLTRALFEELIQRKSGARRTLIVTPVMAQYILDHHNKLNSKIQGSAVDIYASDMAAGRWLYNAEPITFDDDGQLTSGQHRFYACVKAGVSFLTDMVFGLDPGIRARRNSGKKDKPHDYLANAGYANSVVAGGAIRWIILQRESAGSAPSRRTFAATSYPELAKTLERDTLDWCVTQAIALHKEVTSIPAQYLAAMFYLAMEADEQRAQKFITAWVAGKPASIATKCQKHFLKMANDKTRNKSGTDWDKFVVLLLAWNNWYGPRRSDRREIESWNMLKPVPEILGSSDSLTG